MCIVKKYIMIVFLLLKLAETTASFAASLHFPVEKFIQQTAQNVTPDLRLIKLAVNAKVRIILISYRSRLIDQSKQNVSNPIVKSVQLLNHVIYAQTAFIYPLLTNARVRKRHSEKTAN